MKDLWNVLRTTMATIGLFLIGLGITTSDYYVIESEQSEPPCVWKMIVIGIILLLPVAVHGLQHNHNKGGKRK